MSEIIYGRTNLFIFVTISDIPIHLEFCKIYFRWQKNILPKVSNKEPFIRLPDFNVLRTPFPSTIAPMNTSGIRGLDTNIIPGMEGEDKPN